MRKRQGEMNTIRATIKRVMTRQGRIGRVWVMGERWDKLFRLRQPSEFINLEASTSKTV